jgi:hypothetical protein
MSEDIQLVYTGSMIEANFIVELLDENNIGSILRDSMSESLVAGWASGSQEDAAQIYVEADMAKEAKSLIEDYLRSRS